MRDEIIIYRFAAEEGGWAAGTVVDQLEDEEDLWDEEDDATPKNFTADYDDGPYNHLLLAEYYANSTEDDEGSWLLLRRVKGKARASKAGAGAAGGGAGGAAMRAAAKGKGKAPPDPKGMSPTTRASHIAQLRAELAAAEAADADADAE